ncbi:TPA: gamma-glutamyl-gamma-aminobutyrate hydrolase family protein, partial [Campylobacter coli]|nr:gamma-glutamyl-gamma-aminobutyrate hydrolase family protein [Campylobacter coli]
MILLIDNYDSFVFNIKSMLENVYEGEILVVRNDKITLDEIKTLNPNYIILSPGPKHPKDSGVCLEIFKSQLNIPTLGICLGHQALGFSFKAEIAKLQNPMHAKNSLIKIYNKNTIFKDFEDEVSVMRYHSLEVKNLPDDFEILALSDDNVIMAMKHKTLPYFGVQFHPESYFSEYGIKIFANFLNQEKAVQDKKHTLGFYLQKMSENHYLESEDFSEICKIIMSRDYEPLQAAALLVLISEKSLNQKSL